MKLLEALQSGNQEIVLEAVSKDGKYLKGSGKVFSKVNLKTALEKKLVIETETGFSYDPDNTFMTDDEVIIFRTSGSRKIAF